MLNDQIEGLLNPIELAEIGAMSGGRQAAWRLLASRLGALGIDTAAVVFNLSHSRPSAPSSDSTLGAVVTPEWETI